MTRTYRMTKRTHAHAAAYPVVDQDGKDVWTVDPGPFARGRSIVFRDAGGREVAEVRRALWGTSRGWEVLREGEVVARLEKERFTFLRCRLVLGIPGGDGVELVARGDLGGHDYTLVRAGESIARVRPLDGSGGEDDAYEIEVTGPLEDVLVLAGTVVVDLACGDGDGETPRPGA